MTEQPYTAEDVALVTDALRNAITPGTVLTAKAIAAAVIPALAAAGRLLPEGASPDRRMWIFPIEAKVDAILPDGTHRYWSTHCRHNRHEACSATSQRGEPVSDGRFPTRAVDIQRHPAACKSCLAPCICWCHATGSQRTPPVPINEESTDG